MEAIIQIEKYRQGKVTVYRLPDGSEVRYKTGNGTQAIEVLRKHFRDELGIEDARFTVHNVPAPPRRQIKDR